MHVQYCIAVDTADTSIWDVFGDTHDSQTSELSWTHERAALYWLNTCIVHVSPIAHMTFSAQAHFGRYAIQYKVTCKDQVLSIAKWIGLWQQNE